MILFLDFETYYDQQYSLRNMPPPNYILDQRFETIMCAVQEGRGQPYIVDGPDFPKFLAKHDPARTVTVTFNALFDNAILAWRYGFVPARMLDAMGMARALRGHILPRASLSTVQEVLGHGVKGTFIEDMKGKNREAIRQLGMWDDACIYAKGDVRGCADIFFSLIHEFPEEERRIMDLVLRACITPRFECDPAMLTEHLARVRLDKWGMMTQAGLDPSGEGRAQLLSTAKFKELLEQYGVVIEYKTSLTGREVPAFAKSDQFMASLQEHPNQMVQALAAARLGLKSTLEETRTEKLLSIANLPWPQGRPMMPIPLAYGKTHTHRLAGEWGLNMQNLPANRGNGATRKSELRNSLRAPDGHRVLAADLGQIEARLGAWVCECEPLLKEFRDKLDPYALLGSKIFGYPVDKNVHKMERFIGKTGILGLGYGCGFMKFHTMVETSARLFGIDLQGAFDIAVAQRSVDVYRDTYHQIPRGWRRLDTILNRAWTGKTGPMKFGPVEIGYDRQTLYRGGNPDLIGYGYAKLPNGMKLRYANPRFENDEYKYDYGRELGIKIYGAKFLENIVQALARIVVMRAALRIKQRTGLDFQLQAHDELVYVVPENKLDEVCNIIHTELTAAPEWAPDLPLSAEYNSGTSYGEAK